MTDVSKFLLLDRLAVGGMAEVYRAKSLGVHGFEKIIGIKRILPALAEDAEFVQMFVEEAKIAGRLRHANITRIFELGKVDGTHFIAMEYVFGKDLLQIRKRLEQGGMRMPVAMAAWILANVLAGLDYAHRQRGPDGQPLGIIHRDISPQNVLISYDGLVKLCDFGIAKAASRATQTVAGVIKGKLGYMSPEQITGRPIDHRSDVFAATTVLWELLTGTRLFGRGSDFEVLERVRDAKADPPSTIASDVTPALDAIVMRGLARDPDDRWETAGDMHEALMGVVMTSKPPFSTARLAEWMHAEYEAVIAAERAHLERLSAIDEAGVKVGDDSRDAPIDEWEDETVLSDPGVHEEADEVSMVVQIEDVVGLTSPEEPDDAEPPPPLPRTHRTSIEHSEMIALSSAVAMARERSSPMPDRASPAPFEPSLPTIPTPAAPTPEPTPAEPPRLSVEVPRSVSAPELGATPTPAPPAPKEAEGGVRWGLLLLVAFLAAALGMGGVVLWLYLNGHPLPYIQ
ncbi:MAG: serine/threonine protein kinase [Sandaracinaceae bacterium]|nr:serine/threonine protein kinase [Sandaracinaceae bacterium]